MVEVLGGVDGDIIVVYVDDVSVRLAVDRLYPPSWLSMPSLPVARQPHALMAIDTTCSSSRDVISSFDDDNNNIDDVGSETEE